jgi:hypothetical protein
MELFGVEISLNVGAVATGGRGHDLKKGLATRTGRQDETEESGCECLEELHLEPPIWMGRRCPQLA